MRLHPFVSVLAVGWTACKDTPSGRRADIGSRDATSDASTPNPDAASDDLGRPDASIEDVHPDQDAGPLPDSDVDGGILADSGMDARVDPGDSGSPPVDAGAMPDCRDVTFRLNRAASSVWVTGTWTGWAPDPAQGAIALSANGTDWSVTTRVDPPGRHLYKFIIDGATWVPDPSNPNQEPDGFNGFNSVLEICAGGIDVETHQTDSVARTFSATLRYAGSGNPPTPTVTVDRVPVSGAISGTGPTSTLSLTALADGIHDVRVSVGSEEILLKVYINTSTDWRDTTLYFAMTDRFRNGSTNNDAAIGGLHPLADFLGGDFVGVSSAIDEGYFDSLGVNAIWISWPTKTTGQAWDGLYKTASGCNVTGDATTRFSGYHGYWPASGRELEPRFGTLTELQALVDKAHRRGIRILLDFTANHVHSDSPYASAHPGWFNQPPTLCRDGHWDDSLKEECWFDSFLPDWNYTVSDARRQVLDDALWLGKTVGADGFRVDALKHMEDVFVRELRARTHDELEKTGIAFYLVGETFTGDTGLIRAYVSPEMMHGQFDFPSNMAILQGFANDQIGLSDMNDWVRTNKNGYGSELMSTFVGNHDISRFVSKASGQLPCGIWSVSQDQARAFDGPPSQPLDEWVYKKLQLAMTYVYTVPGIPLLYYGDEVGLAGAGDPDNRRMMPAEISLSPYQRATLDFMKKLGTARARHAALRTGVWSTALVADATTLAYARTLGAAKAIVVINRGGARTLDVPVASLGISDGTTLARELGSGSVTVGGGVASVSLGALSAEILVTP
ncbi:MAG: hypothetical protein HY791_29770 [Deltaproteobacteria bacterium]|nr:hypothetical protein [Deltaproteobacteria bacterium]